jgi:hypothetical protein
MTVAELIEELQKLPGDMQVVEWNPEVESYRELRAIEITPPLRSSDISDFPGWLDPAPYGPGTRAVRFRTE